MAGRPKLWSGLWWTALATLILFCAGPISLLMAIWVDWRWLPTGIILMAVGVYLGSEVLKREKNRD